MPDMSLFRSKNTKLEVGLRKLIFSKGFRYRLHVKSLKGSPDLVFPKYKAVIFVHGCFWHAHDECRVSHIPKSNQAFWLEKFRRNRERDSRVKAWLELNGWRVLVIWECALGRSASFPVDDLIEFVCCWLSGGARSCEVGGWRPLPMLKFDIDVGKVQKVHD
ncbi:very short patch repair endonuclease [Photobacterium rosenbergii]|uniref:very short patch repair endonuclease n=1 Tax=Photobacterium rosenbergii TaxID=294936 RepID=UPI001C9A142A|nr:very short patch repair endonuclease [Photobacterium rosenbergii]MBY5949115.1 very short patch repair endonuclease [Photobacterium rosenbergii]